MTELTLIAEAARHERDHRAASYPAKLQGMLAGTADHAARLEAMTIDYQCWVAIAEWVETGRFFGFYGGAEPDNEGAPWISWPALETAAESALTSLSAKCDRLLTKGEGDETYAEACARRARLICIHRKVQLRRQLVDSVNAELRASAGRSARELAAA